MDIFKDGQTVLHGMSWYFNWLVVAIMDKGNIYIWKQIFCPVDFLLLYLYTQRKNAFQIT